MINYEEKYLKYKTKYLELKNTIGGDNPAARVGSLKNAIFNEGFPEVTYNENNTCLIDNKNICLFEVDIKNYNKFLKEYYEYQYCTSKPPDPNNPTNYCSVDPKNLKYNSNRKQSKGTKREYGTYYLSFALIYNKKFIADETGVISLP